ERGLLPLSDKRLIIDLRNYLDHALRLCDSPDLHIRRLFSCGVIPMIDQAEAVREGYYSRSVSRSVMYATVVGTSRQAFAAICLVAHKHGTFTREDADLLGQTVEGVIPPWIFPFYDKPLARGRKWAEHVGKKIKEFREQAQLTQVQLAEKA